MPARVCFVMPIKIQCKGKTFFPFPVIFKWFLINLIIPAHYIRTHVALISLDKTMFCATHKIEMRSMDFRLSGPISDLSQDPTSDFVLSSQPFDTIISVICQGHLADFVLPKAWDVRKKAEKHCENKAALACRERRNLAIPWLSATYKKHAYFRKNQSRIGLRPKETILVGGKLSVLSTDECSASPPCPSPKERGVKCRINSLWSI